MSRNYRKEYDNYQGTLEQKRKRAKRNAARRKMLKKLGSSALRGKDVDHKHGVSAGNGPSNLRVLTKHANRSYPRTSTARKK